MVAPVQSDPAALTSSAFGAPLRRQLELFIDDHRVQLGGCLEGLTEEEARRALVPSRTTLLGLVKHATFVEKVWFDEAVTARSRAEIGIPATPDESFVLDPEDTIETVRAAHARRARRPVRPSPVSDSMTWSPATAVGRCPSAGFSCTCCASWPSTVATPTSSGSRSLPPGTPRAEPVRTRCRPPGRQASSSSQIRTFLGLAAAPGAAGSPGVWITCLRMAKNTKTSPAGIVSHHWMA